MHYKLFHNEKQICNNFGTYFSENKENLYTFTDKSSSIKSELLFAIGKLITLSDVAPKKRAIAQVLVSFASLEAGIQIYSRSSNGSFSSCFLYIVLQHGPC